MSEKEYRYNPELEDALAEPEQQEEQELFPEAEHHKHRSFEIVGKLLEKARAGDKDAKDRLVLMYVTVAEPLIKNQSEKAQDIQDLTQAAYEATTRAINKIIENPQEVQGPRGIYSVVRSAIEAEFEKYDENIVEVPSNKLEEIAKELESQPKIQEQVAELDNQISELDSKIKKLERSFDRFTPWKLGVTFRKIEKVEGNEVSEGLRLIERVEQAIRKYQGIKESVRAVFFNKRLKKLSESTHEELTKAREARTNFKLDFLKKHDIKYLDDGTFKSLLKYLEGAVATKEEISELRNQRKELAQTRAGLTSRKERVADENLISVYKEMKKPPLTLAEVQKMLADDGIEGIVVDKLVMENIVKYLDTLPEREARILKLRFGFEGGKPHTQVEIAKIFGVTPSRIGGLEQRALSKLRHPYHLYHSGLSEMDPDV